MELAVCKKCGGDLEKIADNSYKCIFCGATYREESVKREQETLAALLDSEKREKVANLRNCLWKKVNEEYADSEEIVRLCKAIRTYLPDDFYANFYELCNDKNESAFIAFLDGIDVQEHYSDIKDVIEYSLKSISPRNMLAMCNLIERAYKTNDLALYNEYRTKYDAEVEKINNCVYDPAYPRDVFVCYSSKDMPKVESLVKYLEEQGLECFVAIRNLQHGRRAVADYWTAIHTAIENCENIVFLSSTNSRSNKCDALEELRYVSQLEQKQGKKYKKIEYLLENYTGAPIERTFKKFFSGLEYAYDEDTVFDRIEEIIEAPADIATQSLVQEKSIKICCNCGNDNPKDARFCANCGKDVFVDTQEDYIRYLQELRDNLTKQQALQAEREKERERLEQERLEQERLEQERAASRLSEEESEDGYVDLFTDDDYDDAANYSIPGVQISEDPDREGQLRRARDKVDSIVAGEAPAPNKDDNAKTERDEQMRRARAKIAAVLDAAGVQSEAPVAEERPKAKNKARNKAASYDDDIMPTKVVRKQINDEPSYTETEITEIAKGQRVILPSDIRKIDVEITSEYKLDDIVADLYVFLLNKEGEVLSESDLVFWGNTASLNRSVTMVESGGIKSVNIALKKVHQDITKIRFVLALNSESGKKLNFSMVNSVKVNIACNDNRYIFNITDIGRSQCATAIEFYRMHDIWRLNAQGEGIRGTISDVCRECGIEVE